MKKFWHILRKILLISGITACVAGLVFVLVSANKHQDAIRFSKLNISIDHHTGLFFVSDDDVKTAFSHLYPDTVAVAKINLNRLERRLEQNPFVKEAQVYADMKGELFAVIVQKEPYLRIINNNGVSYYLDENGNKMPVSNNFTARVSVATGFVETAINPVHDSVVQKQLFDLISFIRADDFLLALCEQIDVDTKGEFEIIPKLSKHRFLIKNLPG